MPVLTTLKPLVVTSPVVIGQSLSIDTQVLPLVVQADTYTIPWVEDTEFFAGDQIVDPNGNVQTATVDGFTGLTPPTWVTAQGAFTQDGTQRWVLIGVPDTTRIEVLIYNETFTFLNYTLNSQTSPFLESWTTFTGSINVDPTIPEALLQIRGRNYDPSPGAVWVAGKNYAVGVQIIDNNGNVETVIKAGTSGATVPVWPTGIGVQTTDGSSTSVVWIMTGVPALTTTVQTNLIYFQSNEAVQIGPPSGITAYKGASSCQLEWAQPTFPGTLGVQVMLSTDPTGVNVPFTQFGDIVYNVTRTADVIIAEVNQSSTVPNIETQDITSVVVNSPSLATLTVETGAGFQTNQPIAVKDLTAAGNTQLNGTWTVYGSTLGTVIIQGSGWTVHGAVADTGTVSQTLSTSTTTLTNTQATQEVSFSSVVITPGDVQNATIFYAMLSVIVQDPNTNVVFQSQQNGPVTCGFVNLQVVSPTDFLALQRKEDIAGRIITYITNLYPDLDLSPRSELRDLIIDPFALELANASVREWFSRCANSISAMSQIDDTTGDGFSDPFSQSTTKQQLARAYGLSASDTQSLVDKQFDILGERAGVTRGGVTAAVVELTLFTYIEPTLAVTFPLGVQVSTVVDANTPALTFVTTTSATVTPQSANSYYNPEFGWWAIDVPAQCTTTGSVGNVGAGTIRVVTSGAPNGWSVTNLEGADFGTDTQINSAFAAQIRDREVTGVDSGTRNGYLTIARETPGVIRALVVAAGDLEMVRDWDSIRQKHDFGCVDIYVQGTSFSEQDEDIAFSYENSSTYGELATYLGVSILNSSLLTFAISNFSALSFGVEAIQEFLAQNNSGQTFYFGTQNAQFNNMLGIFSLDPNEMAYQYSGNSISQAVVPVILNGVPANNRAVLHALTSGSANFTFYLNARLQSPLEVIPSFQPVLEAISAIGDGQTGAVSSDLLELIHTSDFLLLGGSNEAGDEVVVYSTNSNPTSTSVTLTNNPEFIDTAMDISVNSNGQPGNVLSVLSADLSISYVYGTDYTIVPAVAPNPAWGGRYRSYALKALTETFNLSNVETDPTGTVLTITALNNLDPGADVTFNNVNAATWLNSLPVTVATATPNQFTATITGGPLSYDAPDTGNVVAQNIAPGDTVVVSYNKFSLYEQLTYVAGESQTLTGTVPTTLNHEGFVHNTWLPESYANTILSYDGAVYNPDGSMNLPAAIAAGSVFSGSLLLGYTTLVAAQVVHNNRYIKVTFFDGTANLVMLEGIDYTLTVDPVTGAASLARILTGHIPDGGTVQVGYFYNEVFTVATEYPSFVEQLATTIATTKHAAADVLIKAMVGNGVDVSATITLASNATASVLDPQVRTIIGVVMANSTGTLKQATMIQQILNLNGVSNVAIPFTKFAKTDGAYDIDIIVPTGTNWLQLKQDPAFASISLPVNSFITEFPVLPDATVPSGGQPNAFVGMLYEGQAFQRCLSIQAFLAATVPSFYIIGTNDQVNSSTPLPNSYAQRVLLLEAPAITQPTTRAYRVTYQTFNNSGAKDIFISSTEYLVPAKVVLNYLAAPVTTTLGG